MPARLAAAVSAAVLAGALSAGTAGASVTRTPGPQHKCESSADPTEHKCEDAVQHKCDEPADAGDEKCDDRTK
jgi:hypothetical protein